MTVWSISLSTLLGLIVFPSFMAATILTLLDRTVGTSFYLASLGGNNWLYEQMFWFMGHPEVYVIGLPGLGVVCDVVAVFSRKPLFGYKLVVGGEIGIFVLSMVVWMHHIYWSGANLPLDLPTMMSTEAISIPTGLVFFALIGTLWRGRIRLEAPMLFALAFIVNFLIGGVTGLYLADVPTDAIFHSNMFVVAHFHFTLVGGAVFGFLAGLYYWFPKMTGRQLDPWLSKLHFWLFEIGFLGTFIPLFLAGIRGEPRWQAYISPSVATANLIASLFAIVIVASVAVFAYNLITSWIAGRRAAANPWGARTLEWTIPSPVPLVNFPAPVVVMAGPYDYGMGGPKTMGRPDPRGSLRRRRGRSCTALCTRDSRADQVQLGTLLMILSDVVFVLAMFLGFLYLHGLNTQGAVQRASSPAPGGRMPALVLAVAAIVAALMLAVGAAAAGWTATAAACAPASSLAWVITLAALVGDLLVFAGLNFAVPFHAYASGIEMFVLYHGFHLLIALIVGGLVIGTAAERPAGGTRLRAEGAGYWFWWVAAAAVMTSLIDGLRQVSAVSGARQRRRTSTRAATAASSRRG